MLTVSCSDLFCLLLCLFRLAAFWFFSLQEVYPLIVSGVQLSTVNAKDEDSLQQEPRFFSISTPQQHFCEDRPALSEVPTGQWSLEGAICTNWGGLKLRADPGSLATFDPNISTAPLGLVTPNSGLARLPALRYPFETTYHLIAPRLYIYSNLIVYIYMYIYIYINTYNTHMYI